MKSLTCIIFTLLFFCLSTHSWAIKTWHGKQKGLVLFMDWSNTSTNVTTGSLEKIFFSNQLGDLSLNQFVVENSMGKFSLSGDILGKKISNKVWSKKNGCRLKSIVKEATLLFAKEYSTVDYDSDNNGKIDNLFIVHSGRIGSDRVGPKCTFTNYSKADHTIVFQANGIGSIGEAVPVGFYLHEGGHKYFRLPDLYDNHKHGKYGIGMWGMMGLGAWGVHNQISTAELFRFPAHFEPLSKIKIGWVKPRVIKHSTAQVELRAIETSGDVIALPIRRGVNYYLEYRSKKGFSKNHHGHGLLLWKNFKLIQADARDDLDNGNNLGRRPLPPIDENFGDASDPFPGELAVSFFENKKAGIKIQNIISYDDKIVMDIIYDDAFLTLRPYLEIGIDKEEVNTCTLL